MNEITYRFPSLSAMADYFDDKAGAARLKVEELRNKRKSAAETRAEAYTLENVANMLRHTEIGADK